MQNLEVKLITEEVPLVTFLLLALQLSVECHGYKRLLLQGLLTKLEFIQKSVLYSDNQSAIHLAKNSVFHSRTKNIGLRYHIIRSLLEDEVLTLRKIQGSKNPIDMLTKVVTIDKLKLCSTSIGLLE